MLNAFKQGDKAGEFTNISTHGCSVVDYCAVSEDLTDSIVKFCVCEKNNKKIPTYAITFWNKRYKIKPLCT